jgi:hypothetical protein
MLVGWRLIMFTLYESEFYDFGIEREQGVAVIRRKPTRFSGGEQIVAENARLIERFRGLLPFGVILDMRAAPAANDHSFEESMSPLRQALGRSFARVVVLVQTVAGEMQVTRLHRSERSPYQTTRSEAQAWLLASPRRG